MYVLYTGCSLEFILFLLLIFSRYIMYILLYLQLDLQLYLYYVLSFLFAAFLFLFYIIFNLALSHIVTLEGKKILEFISHLF